MAGSDTPILQVCSVDGHYFCFYPLDGKGLSDLFDAEVDNEDEYDIGGFVPSNLQSTICSIGGNVVEWHYGVFPSNLAVTVYITIKCLQFSRDGFIVMLLLKPDTLMGMQDKITLIRIGKSSEDITPEELYRLIENADESVLSFSKEEGEYMEDLSHFKNISKEDYKETILAELKKLCE